MPDAELPLADERCTADRAQGKLYFINEIVEWELTKYIWTGCTDIRQRDRVMSHASELIRQIIRKQGLHVIYPGHDDSAFGDLLNTAWCQLERTLYKYRARPHCRSCFNPDRPSDSLLYNPQPREYGIKQMAEVISMHRGKCRKCNAELTVEPIVEPALGRHGGSLSILYKGMSKIFNMWSQIARTVILAYIKKEGRDRKNNTSYTSYVSGRSRPSSNIMDRFLAEAKEICKYNDDHLIVLQSLEWLIHNDDRPYDGVISKLVEHSGMPRNTVTGFMKLIKLRSMEFSDSPISRANEHTKRGMRNVTFDEEN